MCIRDRPFPARDKTQQALPRRVRQPIVVAVEDDQIGDDAAGRQGPPPREAQRPHDACLLYTSRCV